MYKNLISVFAITFSFCSISRSEPVEIVAPFQKLNSIENGVMRYEPGQFTAWPANHGLWSWDGAEEILVGFTYGQYVLQEGHNIVEPRSGLARSVDGGKTWTSFYPENYEDESLPIRILEEPIDFEAPGFVMRVVMGAFGQPDAQSVFYYSYDRGKTWHGPHAFIGIENFDALEDMPFTTPRTDYIILDKDRCLVFASSTKEGFKDKTFLMETRDGGMNFTFVSWIIPLSDPYRAVMPQTLMLDDGTLVSVMRRRDIPGPPTECWLDAYYSTDEGQSWSFLSRVAYTGDGNSNGSPPAMTQLQDGRLIVVYANRSLQMMLCRISDDQGKTWGDEIILRDDFAFDGQGFADFGYPRVVQKADGTILTFYYFVDKDHPEQYIAWSAFTLDDMTEVEISRNIVLPAPTDTP